MVAEFTAKTTNSELAIYFLLLMSCSINKHKFHILFTCKNFCENFVFQFNMEKSLSRKWCGGRWGPLTPFLDGPDIYVYTYRCIYTYNYKNNKSTKYEN